jgi:hypothetical protein
MNHETHRWHETEPGGPRNSRKPRKPVPAHPRWSRLRFPWPLCPKLPPFSQGPELLKSKFTGLVPAFRLSTFLPTLRKNHQILERRETDRVAHGTFGNRGNFPGPASVPSVSTDWSAFGRIPEFLISRFTPARYPHFRLSTFLPTRRGTTKHTQRPKPGGVARGTHGNHGRQKTQSRNGPV